MNNPSNIIRSLAAFLLSGILVSGCEKVIDIDLDEAEKKFVIEANVADDPDITHVIITKSKNFDENNTFPTVSGAVVTVTEQGGTPVVFPEVAPGKYQAAGFAGTPGKNYFLTVSVDGETFTAGSYMPPKVFLDSIYITDEFLFTDTRKIVNAVYKDPPGRGNNYRFIQRVNGYKEKQIQILNDDYTDGNTVTSRLFFFSDEEDSGYINTGDLVDVDLLCIDAAVYRYWFSLYRSALGTSGQATPANPVSNIQGGALGYFSAHTRHRLTLTVP